MAINDKAAAFAEAVKSSQADPQPAPVNPSDVLFDFEVRQEYVDKLGKETFLYPNLIIKQHTVTVIGMSGSGKTAFFFYEVSPKLAKGVAKVWYIDADSPASEHKKMKGFADESNFRFLNPDVNEGTSVKALIEVLVSMADNQMDLTDHVFIFDTLKKFANMMSKESVKDFFTLSRRLTKLGATVIALGHANKYRDKEGNLVYEGVGDVRADSDDLIYLESQPGKDGGIDVTTVVDISKGAKIRGLFQPFSFNISADRKISFFEKVIDLSGIGEQVVPEVDIIEAAQKFLDECTEPATQGNLVNHVRAQTKAGRDRVAQTITRRSAKKGTPEAEHSRFVYTVGEKNARRYENRK